jgi:tetratricopeptide (TPR) repeat protein
LFGRNQTLRHLPFFEQLAQSDESSTAWREVTAGLVVLRLVDQWIEGEADDFKSWGLDPVKESVAAVPSGPVRNVLSSAIAAMEVATEPDVHVVNPRLLAYGRTLEYAAAWSLAIDVYETVVRLAEQGDDHESATSASVRLGFCLRMTGDLERADTAYASASSIADAHGDMVGVLMAQLGSAKNAMVRGNLPSAEKLLDGVITSANDYRLPALESMALHDRGHVAHLRGNHEESIQLAYRALRSAGAPRERDRILGDIANAMLNLGVRGAARDAFLVLAATAQEQYVRWTAAMSLMVIAAEEGMQPLFERYKRDLEQEALPPNLRVELSMKVGVGLEQLSSPSEAITWLDAAQKAATEHEFHQMAFEAQDALARVRAGLRLIERKTTSAPQLDAVAEGIRELRLNLVGG